ncbi:60S ribosomal protein L27-3 [Striga hermonthica]|uniref:60S ribosomal protein L27-3 n=1 Tax=Striga hermonthica TaxID=68872 RepID=A0A9N7NZG2_STRHE|nr:60S ribosomal protein L27-3 [Striga hermonthica]
MVKFLKPNKAVILLQGNYASHKATIVKNLDDGTRDRPYGHCFVTGIAKYPSKVIRKDSAKKSRVKAFIKVVNYNHVETSCPRATPSTWISRTSSPLMPGLARQEGHRLQGDQGKVRVEVQDWQEPLVFLKAQVLSIKY